MEEPLGDPQLDGNVNPRHGRYLLTHPARLVYHGVGNHWSGHLSRRPSPHSEPMTHPTRGNEGAAVGVTNVESTWLVHSLLSHWALNVRIASSIEGCRSYMRSASDVSAACRGWNISVI